MANDQDGGSIQSMLIENRVFPPPEDFARQAHVKNIEQYQQLWNHAKDDPEGFWAEQAKIIDWSQPWSKVLQWNPPEVKWFVGAKTNACHNCVDRHCEGPRKNKAAIIWEGELGEKRVLRYQDLKRETSRFANVLKRLGVKSGDVVAIYMPMVPEAIVAMLACADRRDAYRGVRRIQRRGARGTHPRLPRESARDGRRRLSARQGRSA